MKLKLFVTGIIALTVTVLAAGLTACGDKHVCSDGQMERGDSKHWKICSECHRNFDEEEHTTIDNVCTVCGYVVNYTDGLEFRLRSGDGYVVFGIGTVTDVDIVIPSYYINKPVVAVYDVAFKNNTFIRSVRLPDTVTEVASYAFEECSALEEVILGKNCVLKEGVFDKCTSLKKIVLPEGFETIPDYTFMYCSGLERITLPSSVRVIGSHAFEGCSALEEVNLAANSTLTEIKSDAFIDCVKLKTFTFPQSFSVLGESAFSNCSSLDNIVLPDSVTVISESAFYGCTSLSNLKFGKAVETIGANAFHSCKALKSIVLPTTLKSIGDFAFEFCSGLDDIYYPGTYEEHSAIEKGLGWSNEAGEMILHCNWVG